MIRRLVMGICIAMFSMTVSAAGDTVFDHPASDAALNALLAQSTRPLQSAQTLRGSFTQKKTLSEIPRPLISSGSFVFVRDRGIYWNTQAPLDSEFILTAAGMVQHDAGAQAVRVSSDQQPGLKVAASIFFAMFAMDLKSLQDNFDLFGEGKPEQWQVGLRPKGAMAAVFHDAIISGGAVISEVLLHYANGDSTEIKLRGLQVSQQPPSAEESARLGLAKP